MPSERARTEDTMITVRPAVLGDYEGLCTVIREIDIYHADALPGVFQRADGILAVSMFAP